MLEQIEAAKGDIGEYIFIEELGLLGLSSNKSKVEQKLATVRKESRGADLPEPVASPQFAKLFITGLWPLQEEPWVMERALPRQLFAEGANVVIMDINRKEGMRLAGELNQHGNRPTGHGL